MWITPSKVILASGVGRGPFPLTAFDNALCSIGIGNYNLIKVSSIFPPYATLSSEISLLKQQELKAGSLLPVVYTSIASSNFGERVASCIGIGLPEDPSNIGVIFEKSIIGSIEDAQKEVGTMIDLALRERNIKMKEVRFATSQNIVEEGFSCAVSVAILLA